MCAPVTPIDRPRRPAMADPNIGRARIDRYIMFVEKCYLVVGSKLLEYQDQ
jgi:hypothetical protein